MESRTSPGKRGSVQPISEYPMGAARLSCLAWVSRLVGRAVFSAPSSVWGGSVLPGRVDVKEPRISRRLLLRSSFPDCLESPVARPTAGPPQTSSGVFEASGLSVSCHACGLDRFSFGCGKHVAQIFARATHSKPHSQGRGVPFPWVLSFLPSYLVLFLPYSSVYVSISEALLSALAS